MQAYTTPSNVLTFVPRVPGAHGNVQPILRTQAKVVELSAAARERANSKKRVNYYWTVSPNDLTAA